MSNQNAVTENNTETMEAEAIPRGYMQKGDGSLVPKKLVSPLDLERNELVKDLVASAKAVQAPMAEFKTQAMNDIEKFIQHSADNYDAKMGGKKGNVTLYSFDGRLKVVRTYAEHIYFDERLQAAKALVDECIHVWAKGSRAEIKVLVQDAFQTDKQGNISTGRILGLKRLDIKDEKWQQAMMAITDSMQVAGTKSYIRFYERIGKSEEYTPIALDIAAL